MSQRHDKPQSTTTTEDPSRRDALLRLSGYAAAMAPAMVVLMSGRAHAAQGGNGNGNNGNGNGNGGGNGSNGNGPGNGNGNGPPCDSPAWNLGLSQAGHSGC